ncbi:glycosyltransferase family 2 protein [Brachybacterium paraconglomeratum]|uniref:glycosyltransferase family 2 protein n=1 Tax=Brachybacterium paraconglomeratum TaxID=173362 RepID=UPI0022E55652|nr:glycosyltransferase family 2 protein [Brachybacterium paraconglomeratum]
MSLTDPHPETRRQGEEPPVPELSVSVVIPHFNSTDTIGRALESIAVQTLLPLEVVVVDDCSAPEERETLRGLEEESFPLRVRVLEQERNQGPAAARNRGWEAAEGEWIAFLDSDDSWHPRRLELQARALTPATLMASTHSLVLSEDDPAPAPLPTPVPAPVRLGMGHHIVSNPHTTSSVLLRRDLPVRFTPGRFYAEDYELWIRVAALGDVLSVPVPLAYFHKDPFGTSGLSSRIWKMIAGEQRTFVLLRRDGVLSLPQFLAAEVIMVARIARRLVLRAARDLPGRVAGPRRPRAS